jgi:hypothetical protein
MAGVVKRNKNRRHTPSADERQAELAAMRPRKTKRAPMTPALREAWDAVARAGGKGAGLRRNRRLAVPRAALSARDGHGP